MKTSGQLEELYQMEIFASFDLRDSILISFFYELAKRR